MYYERLPSGNLLMEFFRQKLSLSSKARQMPEYPIDDMLLNTRPDLVIEDGMDRYLIIIKKKVTIGDIAHLNLFKNIGVSKKFHDHLVIAGKIITPPEERIAELVGIKLLRLPPDIKLPGAEYTRTSAGVKFTSEKSWKIISALVKEKMASIRQLSLQENVSYGWAHKTVQALISQGIAARKDNYVSIVDMNKLLNGIAWERPFENLFMRELKIKRESAFDAARYISHIMKTAKIDCAFTSYTAAGLYTGYAMRGDIAYVYVKKSDVDKFVDLLSEDLTDDGVIIRLYAPDRDVFKDIGELEEVIVVSPAQTLLDIASLGYGSKDITKAMVERYAAL